MDLIIVSVLIAIILATITLILLLRKVTRERDHLRALYTNGDGGGTGYASIEEWRRMANASLEASRTRRKNGSPSGKA